MKERRKSGKKQLKIKKTYFVILIESRVVSGEGSPIRNRIIAGTGIGGGGGVGVRLGTLPDVLSVLPEMLSLSARPASATHGDGAASESRVLVWWCDASVSYVCCLNVKCVCLG